MRAICSPAMAWRRASNARRYQVGPCARTSRVGACFRFRGGGSAALPGSGRLRFLDSRSHEPRGAHRLITLACAGSGGRPPCLHSLSQDSPRDFQRSSACGPPIPCPIPRRDAIQIHRQFDGGVAEAFGDFQNLLKLMEDVGSVDGRPGYAL
jgi:hypothetical protein